MPPLFRPIPYFLVFSVLMTPALAWNSFLPLLLIHTCFSRTVIPPGLGPVPCVPVATPQWEHLLIITQHQFRTSEQMELTLMRGSHLGRLNSSQRYRRAYRVKSAELPLESWARNFGNSRGSGSIQAWPLEGNAHLCPCRQPEL